jgi:hypothetical protein
VVPVPLKPSDRVGGGLNLVLAIQLPVAGFLSEKKRAKRRVRVDAHPAISRQIR